MADEKHTFKPVARKAVDDAVALRARTRIDRRPPRHRPYVLPTAEDLCAKHEEEIARRDKAGAALGEQVVEEVRRKVRLATSPTPKEIAALERFANLGPVIESPRGPISMKRPTRGPWRGPTHGQSFGTAADLKAATLRECAARYEATWGVAWDKRSAEVYRTALGASTDNSSRELYTRLRQAIDNAKVYARAHYGQHGDDPAGRALDRLWEHLPDLPQVNRLPGYVKSRSDHARFAAEWQRIARMNLGRELDRGELAELAILLDIGPPNYKQLLVNAGKTRRTRTLSAADVIDNKASYFDAIRSPQGDGGSRDVKRR